MEKKKKDKKEKKNPRKLKNKFYFNKKIFLSFFFTVEYFFLFLFKCVPYKEIAVPGHKPAERMRKRDCKGEVAILLPDAILFFTFFKDCGAGFSFCLFFLGGGRGGMGWGRFGELGVKKKMICKNGFLFFLFFSLFF